MIMITGMTAVIILIVILARTLLFLWVLGLALILIILLIIHIGITHGIHGIAHIIRLCIIKILLYIINQLTGIMLPVIIIVIITITTCLCKMAIAAMHITIVTLIQTERATIITTRIKIMIPAQPGVIITAAV